VLLCSCIKIYKGNKLKKQKDIKFIEVQQMHFGFMINCIISNHQHVLAIQVAIFRVISAGIQIYLYVYLESVCPDHSTVKII